MTPDPGWTAMVLRPDVAVVVAGVMPELPDSLAAEVDAIWNAEQRRHPSLFNGRVFCADDVAANRITGHWTEYRRLLAQVRQPLLFHRPLRALAVNGLLECPDGLVFGRRSATALHLPGCWQAAPAGSVEARQGDDVDLADQLYAELVEELGLGAGDIDFARPVVAMEHAGTHIVDVGFLLRTPLSFATIETLHREAGNREYEALVVVGPDAIDRFVSTTGKTLVESARILIECWRPGIARAW